ncbi:MAG: glutamate synthase-related protein [Saprospiraceae bacterium]
MPIYDRARAMMMALGCIQALECNTTTCPVGVAIRAKRLMKGLDVGNKSVRVASFHKNVHSFVDSLAANGLTSADQLQRKHILHRVGPNKMVPYSELYPDFQA